MSPRSSPTYTCPTSPPPGASTATTSGWPMRSSTWAGWPATRRRRAAPTLQVMTSDATAPVDPVVSVMVDDVEAAYRQAQERGYEIVHPLTTEEWGVTRFFVRAPDGNVLNLVQQHR